jgi:hypothetical protein
MVALLLAGNASFMAGCVYLPLNIGRLLLHVAANAAPLLAQVRQGCVPRRRRWRAAVCNVHAHVHVHVRVHVARSCCIELGAPRL